MGYLGLQQNSRCKILLACLQQLLSGFKARAAAGVSKPQHPACLILQRLDKQHIKTCAAAGVLKP